MRHRHVLALVLATALIFALAGTAFGHYIVPRSKSDSAQCILLRQDLSRLPFHYSTMGDGAGPDRANAQEVVDQYNAQCR
jgi:hypothetical protein